MDMAGIQSGLVGMALFDAWDAAVQKSQGTQKTKGSPLVAAATQAFEAYIQTAELGMAAQISGARGLRANPGGGSVHALTRQDIAPFLAMNVMG